MSQELPHGKPHLERDGWLNSLGFKDVANFRDLAGVDPATPPLRVAGGCLRRGVLYRSSQLQFATSQDVSFLKDKLGIKTYIDLRSNEGHFETRDGDVFDHYPPSPIRRKGQEHPTAPGQRRRVSYHLLKGIGLRKLSKREREGNVKAFPDTWFQLAFRDPITLRMLPEPKTTEQLAKRLEKQLFLNNKAMLILNGHLLAKVLRECSQIENYPLVYGCMTGKDRTGLISCLILGALGATDDVIVDDFMLSQAAVYHNASLVLRNLRLLRTEHPEEFAEGNTAGKGGPTDPNNQVMASVFPGIMRNTLSVIHKELGGFAAYLDSIGFGPEDRGSLRAILVEPDTCSACSKL